MNAININNFGVLVDHHGENKKVSIHVYEGDLREPFLNPKLVLDPMPRHVTYYPMDFTNSSFTTPKN